MKLTINTEVMPGEDIFNAAKEAIALSGRIGARISFNFNGVHVYVKEGDTPGEVEKQYREINKQPITGYRVIFGH